MKYICMVHHSSEQVAKLRLGEYDESMIGCGRWVEELERAGKHVISAGLQYPTTAKVIRTNGSHLSVTDGPFAETKEFLGGFTVFTAQDMDEAVAIASKLPVRAFATLEVRPLMEPDTEPTNEFDRSVIEALQRVHHAGASH